MYDVIIIGGGVIGCAAARELSRYQLAIAVIEKCSDICEGTSKANSGIVHAGFDAVPGTWKAKMNVEGNHLMESYSKELDFPFKRNGSFVIIFEEAEIERLEKLLHQGKLNGVSDLVILKKAELLKMEPSLSGKVKAALYAPSGGIVCPFGLTIALAENAAENGVKFFLDTEVISIERIEKQEVSQYTKHQNRFNGNLQNREHHGYRIKTNKRDFETKLIINAAGVYSDILHNMVSKKKLEIRARKGEYCLLDKRTGSFAGRTIFQLPGKEGKGVLVTPTVHGNLLIGPNALDTYDKEDTTTTSSGLEEVIKKAGISVSNLPVKQIITSFAGLRANEKDKDFILHEAEDAPGFIDLAGIASPGLTSAPAIGRYSVQLVEARLELIEKQDFNPTRYGIVSMADKTVEEKRKLIKKNPAYGKVVCRCETITEGEIMDAIHRDPGARTLDAIKRRTRAGMGRCQAGFCSTKVMEILSRELGISLEKVMKSGIGSKMIFEE